ncbi:MAG: DedA family protein [Acidobacteria bacterium]|nr:DedA family protein [Acidobacteriota bacterium]
MGELEIFLRTYGLWAVFFGAAFEGDLTLLLTGMLIHLDVWPGFKALAVGALGGLSGDLFYFCLGHGTARRWLTTRHGQRVLPHIEQEAKRYGIRSLFIGRYIYGARVATMFFWGMRRLPYRKFLILDAINCWIWVFIFGGLGYLFSNTLEAFIGEMRRIEFWLLIGSMVFFVLLAVRHFWAE